MKCLIVEDDFTARKLLQVYLSDYGECFVAVNGHEAVQAVREAFPCHRRLRAYDG